MRQDVNMYIALNKSYKGLILYLTGLSDKYKCQQATNIINKHLQRNRSKYNLKPRTKHGVKRWETFSLGLYQVFPTRESKRTDRITAIWGCKNSHKIFQARNLWTIVFLTHFCMDFSWKVFRSLVKSINLPSSIVEANCKIVTRLCAI